MALFPCDFCGQRYSGKQSTVYPALARRGVSLREKRRLCPPCASTLEDFLDEHSIPGDAVGFPLRCTLCGSEGTDAFFFATLFSAQGDRQDYYGASCKNCVDLELGASLFGPTAPKGAVKGLWWYLETREGSQEP